MKFESLPQWRKITFILTLFFSNVIVMSDLVLSPTINTLYEIFPMDIGFVNFIVSGMYLIVVIFSPIVSKLMKRWSKRNLLILGAAAASLGGVFLMFFENALWMAVMRGIMAIGYTFTFVTGMAIYNEIYSDEAKRSTIIGYHNAAMNIIGIIFSLLAGHFAMTSIQSVYHIFWIYPLYFILVILFIPNYRIDDLEVTLENDIAASAPDKKEKLGFSFWKLLLNSCLFVLVFNCSNFFVSLYVAENGGAESMTGIINSVGTAIAFIAAFFFGAIYRKLGKKLLGINYFLAGLGVTILWLFQSTANTYLGYILIGGTYAIMSSFLYSYCPKIVPESRIDDAIGYISSFQTLIGFISSYIVTFSMKALNTNFTGCLVVLVVIAAITIIVELMDVFKVKEG